MIPEVVERPRMHYKIAIFDDDIAWEGSLNILAHYGSGDQMRRFADPGVVEEVIARLNLEGV